MLRNVQAGLLALAITVLPVAPACRSVQLSPLAQSKVEEIDAEIAKAEAAGDMEKADALEDQATQVISQDLRDQVGVIASHIPVVGDFIAANPLSLLALGLLSKRVRRNLKHEGSKALASLGEAAKATGDGVLKTVGLKDSSEAAAKADESEKA